MNVPTAEGVAMSTPSVFGKSMIDGNWAESPLDAIDDNVTRATSFR